MSSSMYFSWGWQKCKRGNQSHNCCVTSHLLSLLVVKQTQSVPQWFLKRKIMTTSQKLQVWAYLEKASYNTIVKELKMRSSWPPKSRDIPKSRDKVILTKRGRHGGENYGKTDRCWSCTTMGMPTATTTWKRQGEGLPWSLWDSETLLTPRLWTSAIWNLRE